MRVSPLSRRLTYAALSAGLLAAALVPLTASAATAACPTYVDDAEDSAPVDPALSPIFQDGQLDILSVTHSTAKGVFSTTFVLSALNDYGSEYSIGDWYEANFTVVEKAVSMRVTRDANVEGTTATRLQVDGVTTEVVPEALYDFDKETVTLTVKQAELEKAVGAKLAGRPLTGMGARSLENYKAFGLAWDFADAPEGAVHVFGTACKAGAAQKPAPAPTGAASASPSAKPSASASATPSASASATPSASTSASATASPSGSPAPPQPTVPVPAHGCIGFADAKGDARPGGQAPNDPHLDLLSVTARTTSTTLSGHLQVDKLAARPSFAAFTGHRFEYQFSVGGKLVLLRATAEGPGEGLVDGVLVPDLKVTAAFDVVSSQVVLTVDRAGLAQALGRELPMGTFLEAQVGRSIARSPAVSFTADTASPEDAARARYTVGDNTCFAPKLSVTAPGEVQTSDVALVSIALSTSDGRVAKGQTVTGRIGSGRTATATTDSSGLATLRVPVSDAAGTRELVVQSSGTAGDGELRSTVRVLVEQTRLALRSSGGTVTGTLTDDDGRAVSGQRLVFAFGGRSVAATTDSRGRAAVSVPAGTVVEVSYAGRRGHLAPVKARVTA